MAGDLLLGAIRSSRRDCYDSSCELADQVSHDPLPGFHPWRFFCLDRRIGRDWPGLASSQQLVSTDPYLGGVEDLIRLRLRPDAASLGACVGASPHCSGAVPWSPWGRCSAAKSTPVAVPEAGRHAFSWHGSGPPSDAPLISARFSGRSGCQRPGGGHDTAFWWRLVHQRSV